MSRYRCVDARKAENFCVTRACEIVKVSTSAYYAWAAKGRHGPTETELRDARVLAEIEAIHAAHPDYGSPRVTAELARRGVPCNHKKVAKTMADNGIVARRHRRRRCTTKPDPAAPPIPDLVGRLFDPDNVDVVWCAMSPLSPPMRAGYIWPRFLIWAHVG